MAAALPRSFNGPPSAALPALPVGKTRKSIGANPPPTPRTSRAAPTTPRSGLRAPSTSALPGNFPQSLVPGLPRSSSGANAAGKTLRKTVSINSFPQPPRSDNRITSLPPSPLSAGAPTSRKPKTPTTPNYTSSNSTPSLLNGTGDGRSVARPGHRSSDGVISVASLPQSRSSSAQDSYSTSATQYDDIGDSSAGPRNGTTVPPTDESSNNHQSKGDGKGNIIVSVRVRPDAGGRDNKSDGEWMVDGRKALVAYGGKEGGDYYYDNVFSTHDNNSKVYDHIAKRLVRRVMEGYHGTVFAYGMTGTGKTFSMQGTASSPGVIPLAITDIFSYIRETPSREFLLRVSYLEIYNERIHDLLSMSTTGGIGPTTQDEIKLREDSKRGVYASPLKEEIVQSPTQLLRVIARGDQARRTASTQFNSRSSRSHAVVQIVVESRERSPANATGSDNKRGGLLPGGVRVSTLSLIDLAGSEKAAESKERRTEGSHINKSLLTLGTVISKLSEHKDKDGKQADKDGKHLPYRDSKLTRLLQGALSGNSLVSILCTIQIGSAGSAAASNSHTTETINTLKFASRAKNNLTSHAKRAEEALGAGGDGGARVLLERYRMEILELRAQLESQAKDKDSDKGSGSGKDDEDRVRDVEEERAREREAENRHEEQILEMQLARTALKERIDHLNRLILSSKSTGVNTGGTYSALGIRSSIISVRSIATTNAGTMASGNRSLLERTVSTTSSSSTIGRRVSEPPTSGGRTDSAPAEDDDIAGEFGDGIASLSSQNQALQADLADKNRYIAMLEKRLLQARRASSSRASVGLGSSNKGIMVGEDHSVSAVIREKDAEISELRARLDDKDRMLAALRSAARNRDNADRVESRMDSRIESRLDSRLEHRLDSRLDSRHDSRLDMRADVRTSQMLEPPSSPPVMALPPTPQPHGSMSDMKMAPPSKRMSAAMFPRARKKSVDEVSRMLDEMIQDRVESGHLVRGVRGSVRVPAEKKANALAESAMSLEPLRQSPPLVPEATPMILEA
ncbi:kinesin family protein [Grosmannia clavigera kw1407]|uniref:Kinesin-like protein KIP2 n=1 Tax=Grosmannia clavigera (strain kw1407 / UAMH 11150) TaxID=655863 RepID=F0XIH1_GROCL|nr:kinesin family protein [Grosmannia clavigera kw1407]EFX02504.1 kinesin family protein [Grosmannia clavigera kw1407]